MKRIRKKQLSKLVLITLTLILALMFTSVCAQAAKKKNVWVKSGNYYYYKGKSGKRVTGLKKIGKYYYYFDSTGKQRTGWRKIGKNYRYFTISNGAKGKMLVSQKTNGIKLNKKGVAVVTSKNQRKLALMVAYRTLADQLTNPSQSRSIQRRICYDWTKAIRERNLGRFKQDIADWDLYYAEYALRGVGGDCHTRACAFAYLAGAIGFKTAQCVSNIGHSWTEIDDYLYDPSFETNYPGSNFYKRTHAQLSAWAPKTRVKTV